MLNPYSVSAETAKIRVLKGCSFVHGICLYMFLLNCGFFGAWAAHVVKILVAGFLK